MVENHEGAIKLIIQVIEQAGYEPGTQIALGLDCAASEFYKDRKYKLDGEGMALSSTDFKLERINAAIEVMNRDGITRRIMEKYGNTFESS